MGKGVDERNINPIDIASSSLASRVVDGKHDRPNAGTDKSKVLANRLIIALGRGFPTKAAIYPLGSVS